MARMLTPAAPHSCARVARAPGRSGMRRSHSPQHASTLGSRDVAGLDARDVSPRKSSGSRPCDNGPMPPLPRPLASRRCVRRWRWSSAVLRPAAVPAVAAPSRTRPASCWWPGPGTPSRTACSAPTGSTGRRRSSRCSSSATGSAVPTSSGSSPPLAAALFVLAAAGTARRLGEYAGARDADRIGAWVAVATAALTSHAAIDPVAAKGEILGTARGDGVLLVRDQRAACAASPWHAAAAGALGGARDRPQAEPLRRPRLRRRAAGRRRWPRRSWRGRDFVRLAGAAVGRCPAARPRHRRLVPGRRRPALAPSAYVTLGFRIDANAVLADQPSSTIDARIRILLLVAVVSGLAALIAVVRAPAAPPAPPRDGPDRSGHRHAASSTRPASSSAAATGAPTSSSPSRPPCSASACCSPTSSSMTRHWRHWVGLTTRAARGLHGAELGAGPRGVGAHDRQLPADGVPHRSRHRRRGSSPATPFSCTAGARTSSGRAGCVRRTNTCGRCRCARSTPISRSWSAC